jgi:poly(A) polymerase
MEPRIISRAEHGISRQDINENALKVLYRLKSNGFRGYLAGGCVRDLLLGRTPKDFDVATDATPQQIRKIFFNCRLIGRRFRLAHIHYGDDIIEVATFRANIPVEDNLDEQHVTIEDGMVLRDNRWGTPEQDARRRDFTINAMFYNIEDFSVIDYVGAREDLEERIIKLIGDPFVRYIEDPVRMLRAVRFATTLDLNIGDDEHKAMVQQAEHILNAAPARLYEEFLKFLYSGASAKAIPMLLDVGILQHIFPSWAHWLQHEASEADRKWVDQALRQADIWKTNDRKADAPLLYGLMFGSYHEWLANAIPDVQRYQAIHEAVESHYESFRLRVSMPRRQMTQMMHIASCQPRFEKTHGKVPHKFAERHYFPEALVYFQFAQGLRGDNPELATWWKDFVKENPQTARKPVRPKKAPRRRKPRGTKPTTPEPADA